MAAMAIAWLLFIGLCVRGTKAAVDCRTPPNIGGVKDCCKTPEMNLSAYTDKCPQVNAARHKSPCTFDCVFNASNIFQDTDLNMDNLRTFLTNVFSGNEEFINAYSVAMEQCATTVKQQMAEMKSKRPRFPKNRPGAPNCSPIPFMYAMCAQRNVFINCPVSAWTTSPSCESVKEFTTSCTSPMGGPRGGGPGPYGRRRGGGRMGGGGRTYLCGNDEDHQINDLHHQHNHDNNVNEFTYNRRRNFY